jgi:hypothetical protein
MNFANYTLTTILAFTVATAGVAVPPPANFNPDEILTAIRKVETGGCKDPSNAVGDGGKAIGPLQIHYSYWKDAVEFDPSIGGKYSDCKSEAYARKIVIAYWTRYAPNWSFETLSRVHNGGPTGHKKTSTLDYWRKVQKKLD